MIRGLQVALNVVRVGWCVRLDWPDGTHHLVAFRATRAGAHRAATGLRRFWARGPLVPVSCRLVPVSRHDWRLHRFRNGCRAPDCPTSTDDIVDGTVPGGRSGWAGEVRP